MRWLLRRPNRILEEKRTLKQVDREGNKGGGMGRMVEQTRARETADRDRQTVIMWRWEPPKVRRSGTGTWRAFDYADLQSRISQSCQALAEQAKSVFFSTLIAIYRICGVWVGWAGKGRSHDVPSSRSATVVLLRLIVVLCFIVLLSLLILLPPFLHTHF